MREGKNTTYSGSYSVQPLHHKIIACFAAYTPTLSALTESNNPGPHISNKPSIPLVSRPSRMHLYPGVTTPISAKAALLTTVLECLRDLQLIHIVCHRILEPGKPFDASFKLHRDERLSLLDIVRSRLPNAEFAFQSACHTAQLTDESIADGVASLWQAMLRIPKCSWDDVGNGRYGWAVPG